MEGTGRDQEGIRRDCEDSSRVSKQLMDCCKCIFLTHRSEGITSNHFRKGSEGIMLGRDQKGSGRDWKGPEGIGRDQEGIGRDQEGIGRDQEGTRKGLWR